MSLSRIRTPWRAGLSCEARGRRKLPGESGSNFAFLIFSFCICPPALPGILVAQIIPPANKNRSHPKAGERRETTGLSRRKQRERKPNAARKNPQYFGPPSPRRACPRACPRHAASLRLRRKKTQCVTRRSQAFPGVTTWATPRQNHASRRGRPAFRPTTDN